METGAEKMVDGPDIKNEVIVWLICCSDADWCRAKCLLQDFLVTALDNNPRRDSRRVGTLSFMQNTESC
jgi:hypothetical protein